MNIYSRDPEGLRLIGDADAPLTEAELARAALHRARLAAEDRIRLACLRLRSSFGGFGRARGRHRRHKIAHRLLNRRLYG